MFIKTGIDGDDLPEIGDIASGLSMGCYILRVESSDAADGFA
jgi:hypothetical protein